MYYWPNQSRQYSSAIPESQPSCFILSRQNLIAIPFKKLDETHSLHGISGLVDIGVEHFVSFLELWSILGMVLWSDNGKGLVSHRVVLLSNISGLFGFLLELFEALTHLRECFYYHGSWLNYLIRRA